jgi:hypothetical protein
MGSADRFFKGYNRRALFYAGEQASMGCTPLLLFFLFLKK